MKPLCQKNRQQ